MKKFLKVTAVTIFSFLIILLVILAVLSHRPTPSRNYWQEIPTGGEIEAEYLKAGGFETSYHEEAALQWFKKYEMFYPSELAERQRKYPVIVVSNGTGMKASKSRHILEHYASWGFIVIGTEETYSWNAFGAEMCIRHLERLNGNESIDGKKNIFYEKVDFGNVGIIGHSQGGVSVINAITDTDHKDVFKTAVSLSPTNKELAEALEWPYDATKVSIPVLVFSGEGGGDDWVITGEQLADLYEDIPSDKVAARRKDAAHGVTSHYEDGYVMAWFMWQLKGDAKAAKAFTGPAPEILDNPFYCDQRVSISNQ